MTRHRDELDALLVRRATTGLDVEESRLLNRILAAHPDADPDWVDVVVGELDAATVADSEAPLAPELRSALLAGAPRVTAGPAVAVRPRRTSPLAWSGWAMAAAVAALWIGGSLGSADRVRDFQAVAAVPGAVVAEWVPGDDPTGLDVTGEVVWSARTQEGVMRLRGLAANAPDEFQYQLWIFDRGRDDRYPVDGGVFDMPAGAVEAEVVVRAKLEVDEPTLFAVTVERPGGVVVSSRERVATVAQVSD